jgi:DNA-directed RNA polymerase specialized sigma24 family protein
MPDGDANAERMQMLLRRFEVPLLQFATRITGDRERSRDVVQETFVKFQSNDANGYRAGFVDLVRKATGANTRLKLIKPLHR